MKIFKNKEKRKQFFILFFAILVGVVFILEIVALPLMYREPQSETETPEDLAQKFSKQWIFEENLTEQEKDFLVQRGVTIVSYYYLDNSDFFELESLIKKINSRKPKGQIILEKIKSKGRRVEINSLRDRIVLENLSHNSLIKGFCDTLYHPPADCTSFGE